MFCLVFLRLCICSLKYLIRPGLPNFLGKNHKNMLGFLQANFEYFFEKEPKHCPVKVPTAECQCGRAAISVISPHFYLYKKQKDG